MNRIMDTNLVSIMNYTDMENHLETIVDGITKQTVI